MKGEIFMIDYSDIELKKRKKIIKFFRGTHERFKKINGTTWEIDARNYINNFFDSLYFDEDEQVITTVMKAYRKLKSTLEPVKGNENIYRFLKIIDSIYETEFTPIVMRFYR